MFGHLLTLAHNTFTESIRQPILVVLLLLGVLTLLLNPALSAYTFGEDNRLLIDMGLSTMLVFGLCLSAFTATGVLAREIENRTVLTVISKPVGKPVFLLGKYLGVGAAVLLAYWVWSLVFLMTVRHGVLSDVLQDYDMPVIVFGLSAIGIALGVAIAGNYLYRWVFPSTLSVGLAVTLPLAYGLVLVVGRDWSLQSPATDFSGQLVLAMFLIAQALAILCAVAVAVSTRLGQVMTLMVCVAVFFLGLSGDYLFGQHAQTSLVARAAYTLIPNLQVLWMADALTLGTPVTGTYILLTSLYSALFVLAALLLAVALFQTRETG